MLSVGEALADKHLRARGLFDDTVLDSESGRQAPALPIPLCAALRGPVAAEPYPPLGHV